MEERLQKILSRCGYGSRRACEEYIQMGRVTVNGETCTLGTEVAGFYEQKARGVVACDDH